MKKYVVLISGVGMLGSRYLQGLAKSRLPLRIYVQDRYEASLDCARQKWGEVFVPGSVHEVSFHLTVELLPLQIDIAIVATTADVRPKVVSEIARHSYVRYWVLEKLLAQDAKGIDAILMATKYGSNAWVNTPRRIMSWHKEIKSQLGLKCPLLLKVKGGSWGLICNSIHFLDITSWWTGESLQAVSTERLNKRWFDSKRPGFFEVSGLLEASFSGGSRAILEAGNGPEPIYLELSDARRSWVIRESEGLAKRSDGFEIFGRIAYQSEMSASLVESILERGSCDLPTLKDSVVLHRIFIDGVLAHWRQAGNHLATYIPAT